MLAAPPGFEPGFTDSKSAVLPLDEGAAGQVLERRPASAGQENGAEDGTRTRDPHLGKVMLYQLSHIRSEYARAGVVGAESQSRTGDTAIFSRVLYQLSYLGPMANQARSPVGGAEDSTRSDGPQRSHGLPFAADLSNAVWTHATCRAASQWPRFVAECRPRRRLTTDRASPLRSIPDERARSPRSSDRRRTNWRPSVLSRLEAIGQADFGGE